MNQLSTRELVSRCIGCTLEYSTPSPYSGVCMVLKASCICFVVYHFILSCYGLVMVCCDAYECDWTWEVQMVQKFSSWQGVVSAYTCRLICVLFIYVSWDLMSTWCWWLGVVVDNPYVYFVLMARSCLLSLTVPFSTLLLFVYVMHMRRGYLHGWMMGCDFGWQNDR